MALLKRTMHPHLNSAGPHTEHIDKLSEWQLVVREYERICGKELDETVKMVALIEEAPLQLQEHHRLRYEEIGTDHKKVILSTCAGHGFWRSEKGAEGLTARWLFLNQEEKELAMRPVLPGTFHSTDAVRKHTLSVGSK